MKRYIKLRNKYVIVRNKINVVSTDEIYKIYCGENFSISTQNDIIWSWGENVYGQLALNSNDDQSTPTSISYTFTLNKISSGGFHVSSIDENGQVWSWGNNQYGQLGNNDVLEQLTPVSILGTQKTFCQISCGYYHTMGIDKDGQVWGWGLNGAGQLGNNSVVSYSTPVSIHGMKKTFCQITCMDGMCFAIDVYNNNWTWGNNFYGQLGDNSTINRCTPVLIQGTKKTFHQFSCGQSHVVGLDYYGQVWCWGSNLQHQLGNNSESSYCTPVSIHGIKKTFCQITAGYWYTMGIDNHGQLWGWGDNSYGQLGIDDDGTIPSTPVSVHGTKKTFCQISCGGYHTIAKDNNGYFWSWGYNDFGQLGDNTIDHKSTPVLITYI